MCSVESGDDSIKAAAAPDKLSDDRASQPAPAEEMTLMDNLVFLGYIAGFVVFFYAVAAILTAVDGVPT